MSEKKKVIYVKDLVIKADNVTIEPPKPRSRPYDPFLGPIRDVDDEKKEERVEEVEDIDDDHKHDDKDDHKHKDDDDDRRPFSWI